MSEQKKQSFADQLFFGIMTAVAMLMCAMFYLFFMDGLSIYPRWVLIVTSVLFCASLGSAYYATRKGFKASQAFGPLIAYSTLLVFLTVIVAVFSENYQPGAAGNTSTAKTERFIIDFIAHLPIMVLFFTFVSPLMMILKKK